MLDQADRCVWACLQLLGPGLPTSILHPPMGSWPSSYLPAGLALRGRASLPAWCCAASCWPPSSQAQSSCRQAPLPSPAITISKGPSTASRLDNNTLRCIPTAAACPQQLRIVSPCFTQPACIQRVWWALPPLHLFYLVWLNVDPVELAHAAHAERNDRPCN